MDNTLPAQTNKRFYFEFLFPFLFRPRANARQVAQKKATWLTPLLVVSVLLSARIWFAPAATQSVPLESTPMPIQGPKGMTDVQVVSLNAGGGGGGGGGGGVQVPPGTETPPAEATPSGGMGQVLPILKSLGGLWMGWFLLGVLLYVGMVVSGSSNTFTETLNLVAWSSLPAGVRQLALWAAALFIPTASANPPGLASLTHAMTTPAGYFMTALLGLVDVYLVWQVILILLGLGQISSLPSRKVLGVTLAAVTALLVLAAVPGFLGVVFSQLTQPVPGTY